MAELDGKVAIVTGGGSGIGAACALKLAGAGAQVAVTDIDEAGAKETVDAIAKDGGQAWYLAHDVTDEERWRAVIDEVMDKTGRLDVLVNNAGIGLLAAVTEMSLEDWRRQTAINIDGVFLGTKHAIPAMNRGDGGSIVMISSLAGLQGSAGLTGYCATKGAVRLFAKAVAIECAAAGHNIRVNSVHPGIIDTPIWTKFRPGAGGANAIDAQVLGETAAPIGRAGDPEEIAKGVLFLASEQSSYMTGAELVLDGGIFAGRMPNRQMYSQ